MSDKGNRDEKGRYIKGHKLARGGPGRPSREVEESYFEAFKSAVTAEDWKIATVAVLKKAKKGNVQAYRLLAGYAMGQPIQFIQAAIDADVNLMTVDRWKERADKRREDLVDRLRRDTPILPEGGN